MLSRIGPTAICIYAGTTGALLLRSASISCRSNFKCASTSSGSVEAIHWSSGTAPQAGYKGRPAAVRGERGRPPRTRVRGGDAGECNLRLNPKIEFTDIVAIVPILRRSSAERLLRCSTAGNQVDYRLPPSYTATACVPPALRTATSGGSSCNDDAGCLYR